MICRRFNDRFPLNISDTTPCDPISRRSLCDTSCSAIKYFNIKPQNLFLEILEKFAEEHRVAANFDDSIRALLGRGVWLGKWKMVKRFP